MTGVGYNQTIDDIYNGSSSGRKFVYGENGDGTGSPYGRFASKMVSSEKKIPDGASSPLLREAQEMEVKRAADAVAATGNKKPWYEVLSQLGETGAKIIAATKGGDIENTAAYLAAQNTEAYRSSLPAEEQQKRSMMGWVVIAIIVAIVAFLAWLVFRKKQN